MKNFITATLALAIAILSGSFKTDAISVDKKQTHGKKIEKTVTIHSKK